MTDAKHQSTAGEACLQFDRELADFLEGEARPAVAAHARECPFCRVVLDDLRALISHSNGLPFVDPPARVWANIRATLAAEGVIREQASAWKRWLSPLFLHHPAPAAALAGLVVLAVVLTVPRHTIVPGVPGPARTTTMSSASTSNAAVAFTGAGGEDTALAQTVAALEHDYQLRRTSFEPAVEATYEKSLTSLDHSIHECQASVEKEPDNSLAREYLVAAYEQKAEVLSAALEYDSR